MLVHLPRVVVGFVVLFWLGGCGAGQGSGVARGKQAVANTSGAETRPAEGGAKEPALTRYEYRKIYMWIPVRLVVYAASEQQAQEAARAAYDRIGEIDERMTDYRPTSELMALSRRAGEGPVKVSDELFQVIARAQAVSRETEGAFDITVGPVVKLWREARKKGVLPEAAKVEAARKLVGWEKVKLDPEKKTVELAVKGMSLDLGGIAKGYAGDEAIRVLREHGVSRAFFEAGGDIVVGDGPPGEKGWGVEVTGERTESGEPLVVFLNNAAISTSGDTEQFVEIGGKRYSHIVDVKTGMGLTNRTQVNVLAKDGLTSDPLSTAFSVMGLERTRAFAKRRGDITVWVREERE